MKLQYKHQSIIASDMSSANSKIAKFANLSIIEQNEGTKLSSCMLRGQVDKIVKMDEHKVINFADVLQPTDGSLSLRVVIDGPPGIGKTTLCRKLLNMWSNGEVHEQYNLVLYCPLRNSKIAKLTDLFVYDDSKVSNVVSEVSDVEGKGLLIIFDGWDELSTELRQQPSLVTSIICRKQLSQCSVVVTSRSCASSSLLKMTTISRHVRVLGFSEDEISTVIIQTLQNDQILANELIDKKKGGFESGWKLFKTDNYDSQKAVKLINFLEGSDDIRSLCYVPLVCAAVIETYMEQLSHHQLIITKTNMYKKIVLKTIKEHLRIAPRQDIDPYGLHSLSSLPSQLAEPFQAMCEMAYTNLATTRYELCQSEAVKPEDCLGLMTSFTDEKYQFLHLSFQEFLAAWWITTGYEKKAEEVFDDHFDDDNFRMCLTFVAGLTGLKHKSYVQYFKRLDLQCQREPLFGFKTDHYSKFYLNHQIRDYIHTL